MGSLYELLGFVGTILRESSKLLAKHGKSMLTITGTSILLNCLLLFANLFSTKPTISDFVAKTKLLTTNPGSFDMFQLINDMQQDVRIIVGTELVFFLATSAVLLFSIAAMIQASALAYRGKSLSSMDFVSRLARPFVRPFATFFYFCLFYVGYNFFSLAIQMPLAILLFGHTSILLLTTIILLPTLILWIYLSVVWILALVISVIEEGCYGMEALRQAQKLAKGKKLQGFSLSCVFVILPMIAIWPLMSRIQKSQSNQITLPFLVTIFTCLTTMFLFLNYTVFYFQCKKTNGEDIELQISTEYSKIPSTALAEDEPLKLYV